jgi:erythromycin esterase-like protein
MRKSGSGGHCPSEHDTMKTPHTSHTSATNSPLSIAIAASAHLLNGTAADYDPLLEMIGDAHVVLLGEASHGTHEFYHERAEITRRLIREKGFGAVVVEADWPDAYRVNRYVRGASDDGTPQQALDGFKRFPTWMWRNTVMVDFVDWLRAHNAALPDGAPKTGFYGLDLYSLFTSMEEVLRYLDNADPEAARMARQRYACFEHFAEDSQYYGYAASTGLSESCEQAVQMQLRELQARMQQLSSPDGEFAADEFFHAEQNARLVMNAEQYYRSMFHGRVSSWNLRDRHMADTLDALSAHLARSSGQPAKLVVWAHNSHIGDARATELGRQGEWTVGQLARERYGDDAVLIGFTTYSGSVTAASEWDGPAERKSVRPGLPGSYEQAFHDTGLQRFLLPLRATPAAAHPEFSQRLERAIGVIYLPQSERRSHYFDASLAQQFDAVIHIDDTQALTPLERIAPWHDGEAPETFPHGL